MVGNGYADVKKIEGNTIVWNQLLPPITNPASSAAGLTITQNGDGSYSISGTSTNSSLESFDISRNFGTITQGHVYFCRMNFIKTSGADPSSLTFEWTTTMNTQLFFYSDAFIVTSNQSGAGADIMCAIQPNISVNFTAKPILIDLTKMFGAGNEPTTVEEFERLFPMEYAPYCEGRLVSLGGYKIKWNQLVQNGNFSTDEYWVAQNAQRTISNNTISIVADSTSNEHFYQQNLLDTLISGHKLYFSIFQKTDGTTPTQYDKRLLFAGDTIAYLWASQSNTWEKLSALVTVGSGSNNLIRCYTPNTATTQYKNVQLFDLTEMFGPGSEPTLEEFESMFGTEYGPYDEGTEMNILQKMDLQDDLAVKSTGFNLWDEEWENGDYDNNGVKHPNSLRIRSAKYIPCFPSTTYHITCAGSYSSWFSISYYDSDKNFILQTSVPNNDDFITLDNYYYFNFNTSDFYGGTYQNNICINFSDPAKNGTYLPYTTSTQDLSWIYDLEYTPEGSTTSEKLFPYGLLSAGDVHDEVTDTQAIKRVGVVDLGNDLIWTGGVGQNTRYTSSIIPNCKTYIWSNYKSLRHLVLFKYTLDGSPVAGNHIDNTYVIYVDGSMYVNDYTCESLESFTNYMKNRLLYYELETPITITFPSPKGLGYNVQSGGTEQLLPTNPTGTGPVTAPIIESVNYPLDAVGTLTNLPKNYISVESMDSFTTALGNAMNLNITKTWDSTNNKWSFSVTSRS